MSARNRSLSADSLASSVGSMRSMQSSLDTARSRMGSTASFDGYGEGDDDGDVDEENDEDENAETPSAYDEEEDDPLGVKKLALSFDYLLYKISSKMETLAENTELSVTTKHRQADEQIIDVQRSMDNLKTLIKDCEHLETDFAKLEQIGVIVHEFKERVATLERYFKA